MFRAFKSNSAKWSTFCLTEFHPAPLPLKPFKTRCLLVMPKFVYSRLCVGEQWLRVRVLDSIPRAGSSLTSVTSLCLWARHINPSLVLVQPGKTRPLITERLLMERKESNQTKKKNKSFFITWESSKLIFVEISQNLIKSPQIFFVYLTDFNPQFKACMQCTTVVPTKSDSDAIFCLQLLSKTLTCTLHLS